MFESKLILSSILSSILFFIQIEQNFGTIEPEEYLRRYGYLETTQRTEGAIKEALKTFQSLSRLPITGVFDERTRKMMSEPRCGNKDPVRQLMNRTKGRIDDRQQNNYVLEGSKWTNYKLTYKIINYSKKLDQNKTLDVIKKAFKIWSSVTPLRFIHETNLSRKVHFDISFERLYHRHPYGIPENNKFDGKGGSMAHATYPSYGGDIHYDDDDDFDLDNSQKSNLPSFLYTSVHEMGHALGLEHTWDMGSVMFFKDFGLMYIHNQNDVELDEGTIEGIRVLYGNQSIKLPD